MILESYSGHVSWANSAAMAFANIPGKRSTWCCVVTKALPLKIVPFIFVRACPTAAGDPPGGVILRDANGQPTGIFIDTGILFLSVAFDLALILRWCQCRAFCVAVDILYENVPPV